MLNLALLKKGSRVAVALSGGKDSVCLLYLLLSVSGKLEIEIKAVNVEHGIRGESSLRDSEFVKNLCEKLNVPLKSYSVNSPERAEKNGESEEQAARFLRYECFKNAISCGFCDYIATAHHAADVTETLLLNIIRGSSLKGLCSIPETAMNGKIIRPLLYIEKSEIENYVLKNNLQYVTDETNLKNDYNRNYLRNEVIPLIEKRFPSFQKSVCKTCKSIKSEDEYLDRLALKLTDESGSFVIIPNYSDLPVFKRACVMALKLNGFIADYTENHINELVKLAFTQTGKRISLKCGITAYKSYDRIIFKTKSAETSSLIDFSLEKTTFNDYELSFEKITRDEFLNCLNNKKLKKEKYKPALFFDLDKLPKGCVVRTKRQGDVITDFGGKTKTLKKYLTDKKVSTLISCALPLIAKENIVYIVSLIDVSALLKVDESSKNIVKYICINKGER
mgnify:CR=1